MAVRSTRQLLARGALGGMVAILASGIGSAVLAADHTVDISGFAFSPRSITVAVGDTVTWVNADAQGHTATADDGAFDTGTISGNGSGSVRLTTAGTFGYHCRIHPAMTATIVVAAAAPATDAAIPASTGGRDGGPTVALLAIAALGGLALARRRFGAAPPTADRD